VQAVEFGIEARPALLRFDELLTIAIWAKVARLNSDDWLWSTPDVGTISQSKDERRVLAVSAR